MADAAHTTIPFNSTCAADKNSPREGVLLSEADFVRLMQDVENLAMMAAINQRLVEDDLSVDRAKKHEHYGSEFHFVFRENGLMQLNFAAWNIRERADSILRKFEQFHDVSL